MNNNNNHHDDSNESYHHHQHQHHASPRSNVSRLSAPCVNQQQSNHQQQQRQQEQQHHRSMVGSSRTMIHTNTMTMPATPYQHQFTSVPHYQTPPSHNQPQQQQQSAASHQQYQHPSILPSSFISDFYLDDVEYEDSDNSDIFQLANQPLDNNNHMYPHSSEPSNLSTLSFPILLLAGSELSLLESLSYKRDLQQLNQRRQQTAPLPSFNNDTQQQQQMNVSNGNAAIWRSQSDNRYHPIQFSDDLDNLLNNISNNGTSAVNMNISGETHVEPSSNRSPLREN